MKRFFLVMAIGCMLGSGIVFAADSPIGMWKTVDDKTGKVKSEVQIYEQGGKLFGKITALTDPTDKQGKPRMCTECKGADKNKPIVGLVILKDLSPSKDRYKGGTILDPEDGKVYKAQIWIEDGKLKVRGYLSLFHKTQTWIKGK
jgi:uncharacterized protein (DUF2147 family)